MQPFFVLLRVHIGLLFLRSLLLGRALQSHVHCVVLRNVHLSSVVNHRNLMRIKLFSSNDAVVFLIRGRIVDLLLRMIVLVKLCEIQSSVGVLGLLDLQLFSFPL